MLSLIRICALVLVVACAGCGSFGRRLDAINNAMATGMGGYCQPAATAPGYYTAPNNGVAANKVESVMVLKVLDSDSKVLVQRRNGEVYLIEHGIGALSLWQYEGREVLVVSPGLFAGVGSSLVMPNHGQTTKIWNSDFVR